MRTVLVADDELGTLLLLELLLDEAGYRVVTAGNGRQALELAGSERPDLVLLDWMMPVMDGAAALASFRRDPALARIPVVVMSGAAEATLRRHLDGHAGFLQKPFLERDVLAVVERVLRGTERE